MNAATLKRRCGKTLKIDAKQAGALFIIFSY